MKKKVLIGIVAILIVVVVSYSLKVLIQENVPAPKESYNKTLKVLYLGDKSPMFDAWLKDGMSVQLSQNLTNYNNTDLIVVSKEFYNKLDIETAKKAIKEGKQFFFTDVTDNTYIESNFLDSTSNSMLLKETSIVQLYYAKNRIQSTSVILKTPNDYINNYRLISKNYEDKKKLMAS